MCGVEEVVLCSSFPRPDSGPGGLNAVLRIKVILLNPFPPVLRHFSKSRGASVRPSPQFESTCACARFFYMSFSGLLFYHALRSSAVAVCEPGIFGPSGVQFQTNVLPRGNGRSISRGSVRRDPNTARTGRWWCGEIGQTCEQGGESGERRGRGRGVPKVGSRAVCAGAQLLPKSSPFFFFSRGLLRQSSHFFS